MLFVLDCYISAIFSASVALWLVVLFLDKHTALAILGRILLIPVKLFLAMDQRLRGVDSLAMDIPRFTAINVSEKVQTLKAA